ncbi:MAG TPA: hypothetical protein VG844_16275 [Terracidiphilus sp.]|nr:hypothetical protein [Terracidiphilus sp.]
MKQILAIFVKDARRFWPEILICISLLVAFVLVYPTTWRVEDNPLSGGHMFRFFGAQGPMGVLAYCLVVLVPVAWVILTARAIHCDRLVGNTQHWITRPYDWRKLLAAKFLYLVTFLYAPFFIAQCVLLREAGFNPFHYLGGLFFNLFLLTAACMLPLVALVTLTKGFGRLMLVLLGLVLVIAATAGIVSVVSYSSISLPDLLSSILGYGLLICGSMAAIIVMYARRNAKVAWLTVLALTVAICLMNFFDPDAAVMNHYFPKPAAGTALPVTFAFGAPGLSPPSASLSGDEKSVVISIPVAQSGVSDGNVAVEQAVRVSMENGRGEKWVSPWEGTIADRFLPGSRNTWLRFQIRRKTYEEFKNGPVTLRISVAMSMAHVSSESVIPLRDADFAVPEIGVCKPTHWMWNPDELRGISCRSAMNTPQLTNVSVTWKWGDCRAESTRDQIKSNDWAGGLDPGPAEFGITSVWDAGVNLTWPALTGNVTNDAQWSLCAGTPMRFTQYETTSRLREELSIPAFEMPELTTADQLILLKYR